MYAVVDRWLRAHPMLLDAAVTAGVALLALADLLSNASSYQIGLLGSLSLLMLPRISGVFIVLGLLTAPLLLRRRHPTWCFGLISVGALGQLVVLDRPSGVDVAVPLAAYAMAAYGEQAWARRTALGVGVLGALLGGLRWAGLAGVQSLSLTVIFLFMVVALAWVLGYYRRTRRLYVEGLEERAHRLETEREQQQQLAAQRERARIAREMHDIVAHSLSVIVLQADGGTYAAEADPATAVSVLQTISGTGRQALTEMRRLLGVLREETAADLAPQPGLARLAEIVTTLRGAGHPTELVETGEARALSAGADLTAFRIVQEAATNILRHAGPGASARIEVHWRTDGLDLRITDDGRGAAALPDGTGHGLPGMAERVAAYGGTMRAAPAGGGGFVVAAHLPIEGGGSTIDPAARKSDAADSAVPAQIPTTGRLVPADGPPSTRRLAVGPDGHPAMPNSAPPDEQTVRLAR